MTLGNSSPLSAPSWKQDLESLPLSRVLFHAETIENWLSEVHAFINLPPLFPPLLRKAAVFTAAARTHCASASPQRR